MKAALGATLAYGFLMSPAYAHADDNGPGAITDGSAQLRDSSDSIAAGYTDGLHALEAGYGKGGGSRTSGSHHSHGKSASQSKIGDAERSDSVASA